MEGRERNDEDSDIIDVELLIAEIEKRPALYDTKSKEYSDRNLKIKQWAEVCALVFQQWSQMDESEKIDKGKLIQKRWKNIRDCFKKELRIQKQQISGQSAKKRHKYIYFDQLLFLIPTLQERPHEENYAASARKNTQSENESVSSPDGETERPSRTQQNVRKKKPRSETGVFEEELLQIVRGREQEIDEDKSFLLSLVPSFKKLTEQRKFTVKSQFLNSLQNALFEQSTTLDRNYSNSRSQISQVLTSKRSNQPIYLSKRNNKPSASFSNPSPGSQPNLAQNYDANYNSDFEYKPSTSYSNPLRNQLSLVQNYVANYNPDFECYEAITSPTGTSTLSTNQNESLYVQSPTTDDSELFEIA